MTTLLILLVTLACLVFSLGFALCLLVRIGSRQSVAEGALILARRVISEKNKVIDQQRKTIEELRR